MSVRYIQWVVDNLEIVIKMKKNRGNYTNMARYYTICSTGRRRLGNKSL